MEAWDIKASAADLVVHEGMALFASTLNTPSFGAKVPAEPHARIDDSALDVIVAGSFSRLGALAMLPHLLTGRHITHPKVAMHAVAGLRLTSKRPIPIAADGEF